MVHAYTQNGYNIVIDSSSGSIHSMDDYAYAAVLAYKSAIADGAAYRNGEIGQKIISGELKPDLLPDNPAELLEYIDGIEHLISENQLFTDDIYEDVLRETARFQQARRRAAAENGCGLKAVCLHVAHSCNLNCEYCFAAQGKYQGRDALMSLEVAKKSLDFLIKHSGNHINLDVDFFGGEPLLNWNVVKSTVAYGRELERKYNGRAGNPKKRFRFTLTTNGILIDDDVIDFTNREMVNVVLSLDGRKHVHDSKRVDYSGQGSYDRVVPKFQHLVKSRLENAKAGGGSAEYYIRGTYTHENPDFIEDIKHMLDLGFRELSLEPVVCSPEEPYALTDRDFDLLVRQYEELAELSLEYEKNGDPFNFYHYMIDLEHGPCIHKKLAGCGSGTEYIAITPQGDIYPCHQFAGDEKYLLGNIYDGIMRSEIMCEFADNNIFTRDDCAKCWAQLYCAGGCAANAYHATGDIRGNYAYGCELFKKRIECAIARKISLSE